MDHSRGKSKQCGNPFSGGTCFPQKGRDTETKGTQFILWRKSPWLHFSGPGDSHYYLQKVRKSQNALKDMLSPTMGVRIKKQTSQPKNPDQTFFHKSNSRVSMYACFIYMA